MALYLYTANYTLDAVKALIKEPQDREAAARKAITAAGGKMQLFFAALGSFDVGIIAEFPNDTDMAAVSLVVGAAGGVTNGTTTKLLTSSEFKEAVTKAGNVMESYRPPQG